jgi:Protein of unknown function (DUF2752)
MVIERRALEGREVDHERLWLSIALAGAALGILWIASGHDELPRLICPFRHVTGVPCIGCGGTRALVALAHGDLGDAFFWNPLVTVGAIGSLLWLGYATLVITFGAPRFRVRLEAHDRLPIRIVVSGALVANWIFLILQGR